MHHLSCLIYNTIKVRHCDLVCGMKLSTHGMNLDQHNHQHTPLLLISGVVTKIIIKPFYFCIKIVNRSY